MATRADRRREPAEPPDGPAAFEIAVRFLATRPRTRWEVEGRLRRAGADEATRAATISRLVELELVDDAAFARWWGEQRDRHAPRGRRMIEAELRRHGIGGDVIEAFRDGHDDPERAPEDVRLPGSEAERARDALDRHLRGRPVPVDPKARQRIGMFLMRRGFDPETVRSTIRSVAADTDADPESP
jgi:regulatory protein